jgi:hypothetical protein
MTQVTEEQAVDVALDHLRSALDLLDQADRHVESALTDHIIQMLDTAGATARPA